MYKNGEIHHVSERKNSILKKCKFLLHYSKILRKCKVPTVFFRGCKGYGDIWFRDYWQNYSKTMKKQIDQKSKLKYHINFIVIIDANAL